MKIAVVGAQCVGKTTFIQDVLKVFPEFKTSDYSYRDAIKSKKVEKSINRETNIKSQKIIFNALADEIKHAEYYTLLDRCVMDAVAYTIWPTIYKVGKTDITEKHIQNMLKTAYELMTKYDLIIYIPVDENVLFEADQFRDVDPDYRIQMAQIFEDLLILDFDSELFNKYGYKVACISGTREERIQDFSEIIKPLRK